MIIKNLISYGIVINLLRVINYHYYITVTHKKFKESKRKVHEKIYFNCDVMAFTTQQHRGPVSISNVRNFGKIGQVGRIELDSHADTIVAGGNCVVMSYTGRECDVTPYDSTYKARTGVPIANVATAWQSAHTGQVYILVFNEALWMPHLPNTLVNPNQLRHFGIKVQDNPYDAPMYIQTEDGTFGMELQSREQQSSHILSVLVRRNLMNVQG